MGSGEVDSFLLQAAALDKTGVYQLKLDEAHHRLGLSMQLYSTPDKTLDKVTALLEQVQQRAHAHTHTHFPPPHLTPVCCAPCGLCS